MEDKMKRISNAADNLVSKQTFAFGSLEETWNKHIPDDIKKDITFKEVKDYIDEKVELGNKILSTKITKAD